jgi:hypothetical protein
MPPFPLKALRAAPKEAPAKVKILTGASQPNE